MIKAGYYEDVITVEDGALFRTVIAHWVATRRHDGGYHAVYRIDENGREYCRALMYSCSGYRIDETELKNRKWYNPGISLDLFKFGRYEQLRSFDGTDAERICSVHPDFKYVVQKAGEMPVAKMFNILIAWKKNNNVELLVGANLDNLALNKSFAKMTKPKQKAMLNFIRVTPGADCWSLAKINFVMNKKGSPQDFDAWQKFRPLGKVVDYRWFKKYGPNRDKYILYIDYMQMGEHCGHNMKEDYWKYPSDIKKAHDKVMREYKRVLKAEKLAREEERKERERIAKHKLSYFAKLSAKFDKKTAMKNGFFAFVPGKITLVQQQAKALRQCLITCDYAGKMARKECLLVFIRDKKGAPVATAEIKKNGSVNQFYGDESARDIKVMKPGPKVQECLNLWLEKYKDDVINALKGAA